MADNVKIRTYPEASARLFAELKTLQRSRHNEFSDEIIARLVHYVFGTSEEDVFWSLVSWFKTFEPHDSTWHTFYFDQGSENPEVRSRDISSALDKITKGLNEFCAEHPLLNDALDLLDKNYRARLTRMGASSLPAGNLAIEFRGAVKDSQEAMLDLIKRGAPARMDYLIEYMLAVYAQVFPQIPPTGAASNTFSLFATAVFAACFYYAGDSREISVSGLASRVRNCVEADRKLFEYSADTDSVVATEEMKIENSR